MSVTDWLLAGDPAIRWQTLRDVLDGDPLDVAAERARVAREGWGARLLSLQQPDGSWAGGAWRPAGPRASDDDGQPWTSTAHVLTLLLAMGADPEAAPVRDAAERAFASVRWEDNGAPFLEGEDEACTLATTIAVGASFGHDMTRPVTRLLSDRRDDGGWNCDPPDQSRRSSFHSTLVALEALEAQHRAVGLPARALEAVDDAREFLLVRHLMRRRSTGKVVDQDFLRFSFPTYWHYDVLRALDHLRACDAPRDPRLADAIALVQSRRSAAGLWPLENTHRGAVPFVMEDGDGRPSRWNTLRALRVLKWWNQR